MMGTKSILTSRTIWSALVMAGGTVATWLGVEFNPEEQQSVVDGIMNALPHVAQVAGLIGVIWGRLLARKEVTVTGAPR